MAQRQISPERKGVFYAGMAVGVVGFFLFISVFLTSAASFGDFTNFAQRARTEFTLAVIGMVLMIGGGILTAIGRMGLAGSGIKLDPEAARRDVEPWSRMTGGVVKDVLDEAGIRIGDRQQDGNDHSLDERLRRLEKLHQDGLINDQEYQTTRKRILESA